MGNWGIYSARGIKGNWGIFSARDIIARYM